MGRELTMGVSSTKLDRQQQNFSGHILLSWSVVLQGRPARQNGGDHDWLIQTPVSTVQWDTLVPPDAVTYFHSEIQDCPCIGAAEVNDASWQPTSCQNRHSEAADNAGIARKRQHSRQRIVGMHSHKCAQVMVTLRHQRCPGCINWHAINSITSETFWKPVTGWKPVYQLPF